jgi:hypothetical protein
VVVAGLGEGAPGVGHFDETLGIPSTYVGINLHPAELSPRADDVVWGVREGAGAKGEDSYEQNWELQELVTGLPTSR